MAFYEYKNHRVGKDSLKPDFIDFPLPLDMDNGTNIAYIPNEEDRNYYVPDTLVEVTIEQIKNRALLIHNIRPFGPLVGDSWSDSDVINWIESVIEKYK
jgi:hypothetical protein